MSEKYIRVEEAILAAQEGADVWDGGCNPERDKHIRLAISAKPTYTPAEIMAGMWVPVTPETMPDYDVPVFVSDGVNTWVDRWRKCGQWDYCEEPDAITHWMPLPLPKPPKEEKISEAEKHLSC